MKDKRIFISITLFILFIVLCFLAKLELLRSIDTFIYNIVTTYQNSALTYIHKVFTFLGSTSFIICLTLFCLLFASLIKKNNKGIIITVTIILSTVLNNVVKLIVRRERPVVLKLVSTNTFSFPSGHTMTATSMCLILIYLVNKSSLDKRVKIMLNTLLIIMPILVGISRIYLGAHFFTDVVGAYILSISLVAVITAFIDKKSYL